MTRNRLRIREAHRAELLLSTSLPLESLPSLLPSSVCPPEALAMPLAALVPEAMAMNETAPVASMLLAVVAVVDRWRC